MTHLQLSSATIIIQAHEISEVASGQLLPAMHMVRIQKQLISELNFFAKEIRRVIE
jgi:hypothetical protein